MNKILILQKLQSSLIHRIMYKRISILQVQKKMEENIASEHLCPIPLDLLSALYHVTWVNAYTASVFLVLNCLHIWTGPIMTGPKIKCIKSNSTICYWCFFLRLRKYYIVPCYLTKLITSSEPQSQLLTQWKRHLWPY